jgi:predicted helicase
MQGVSINILVKTGKKKKGQLAQVFHADLYGKRDFKYDFLSENSLKTINFIRIKPFKNSYVFKYIDENLFNNYNSGLNPTELFKTNVMGFQTHRDRFCIDANKNTLVKRLTDFSVNNDTDEEITRLFGVKSTSDFNIQDAQNKLQETNISDQIIQCSYRPFDNSYIYFDRCLVDRPRKELIDHSKNRDNLLLGIGRQGLAIGDISWCLTSVSKYPVDANMFRRGGVNLFPLYLYPEDDALDSKRIPNLDMTMVADIEKSLGLKFVPEKAHPTDQSAPLSRGEYSCQINDKTNSPSVGRGGLREQDGVVLKDENSTVGVVPCADPNKVQPQGISHTQNNGNTFAPIDLLDYIYAVLHNPSYREKYKEFLKIDFPRVPYPTIDTFWQLVKLGGELRQIHLLESPVVTDYITSYPIDGDNVVEKPLFKNNRVYINKEQYFDTVPQVAWEFYIGGYQPAQKWLKDRKERTLEFDDILHYQKIIVALSETDRLMKEIDKLKIE